MGLAGLIGCGGGSTTSDTAAASYRISGSVVGLTTGGLVLSNAGSTIGVAAGADRFAFDTSFTGSYRVTVLAQPDGQTCSVRSPGGSGGADVTAMQVVCRGYAAYVAHEDSQTLAQFSVAEDGSLTAMAAPTLALTYQPAGLVLRGDGAFAWLRYGNHRQVTALAADAVSGALSLVGHAPSYSAGYGLALHPELDVLYSADYGGAALSQFSLDSRGLPVALTVPRLATEINPKAVVVSPDGAWVFVANASSESVSQYSVGSSGALAIPTLPTVASVSLAAYGSGPSALAVDPTGSRLFSAVQAAARHRGEQELHLVGQDAAGRAGSCPRAGWARRAGRAGSCAPLRAAVALVAVAGAAGGDAVHPAVRPAARHRHDVLAGQVVEAEVAAAVGADMAVAHEQLGVGQRRAVCARRGWAWRRARR
jgi:DNA-binding beta-propeller fold protein YncE